MGYLVIQYHMSISHQKYLSLKYEVFANDLIGNLEEERSSAL